MANQSKVPMTLMEHIIDLARTIAVALVIAIVIRTLFVQPFHIPSASMRPGLQEGDYILVSKFSYGYSKYSVPFGWFFLEGWDSRIFGADPERGDVAVFRNPKLERQDYIKRVIGLPGDTISISEGVLSINGQTAELKQLFGDKEVYFDQQFGSRGTFQRYQETLPGGHDQRIQYYEGPIRQAQSSCIQYSGRTCIAEEFVIPEGKFLMMGDNRDNSTDSRFAGRVGLVDDTHLVGEAQIIVFSWRNLTRFFRFIN